MGQWLRVCTAPNTHVRRLTTCYIELQLQSEPMPLTSLGACSHVHIFIHRHTNTALKINLKKKTTASRHIKSLTPTLVLIRRAEA